MTGEGIPKKSVSPTPPPASESTPRQPEPQPRSGSGSDTALEAMIRKRLAGASPEPTVPGEGQGTDGTRDGVRHEPGV